VTVESFEIKLPQWGMGMREGTVVRWLKGVGDPVSEGEEIVEIEADKVTAMVSSPMDGTLVEIRVGPEETVAVRTVLAILSSNV